MVNLQIMSVCHVCFEKMVDIYGNIKRLKDGNFFGKDFQGILY